MHYDMPVSLGVLVKCTHILRIEKSIGFPSEFESGRITSTKKATNAIYLVVDNIGTRVGFKIY